jgi:hypothetical protein
VTTHAQTCDGPSFSISYGLIVIVYKLRKLLTYKGFILISTVNGTIKIPTGGGAIRTNNHQLILVGQLLNMGYFLNPVGITTARTMQ